MNVFLILMCISPGVVFCRPIESSNVNDKPNLTKNSLMNIHRNVNKSDTESENKQHKKREIIVIKTGKDGTYNDGAEDETLSYVSYITKKLKNVQNIKQRLISEHLIETSIYKAFLGQLTDKSDILERDGSVPQAAQEWTSSQQVPHVSRENVNMLNGYQGETTQPVNDGGPAFFAGVVPNNDLPVEQRRLVRDTHTSCQDNPNTYVSEDLLRQLRNNKDNRQVQVHMFCMIEQMGMVENNGELNPRIVRNTTSFIFKEDAALNAMYRKCAVTKRTKEETITYFWLCLLAESSQYTNKV